MQDRAQDMREYRHLEALPLHPAPEVDAAEHRLRVTGAVSVPASYSVEELLREHQLSIVRDFDCEEGWVVEGVRCRGIPLATLLDRAWPKADARWVKLSSGDFSITLPLEEARAALVAVVMDDEALPVEHGGPMRLLVRGGQCFTSIKWLESVELTTEDTGGTAREIALRRIGKL
jgi:DMSO/TMAO reductase YedYZ molybdopterin-dependent catalytic subunit